MQRNSYCSLKAPSAFLVVEFLWRWFFRSLPCIWKSASGSKLAARMASRLLNLRCCQSTPTEMRLEVSRSVRQADHGSWFQVRIVREET